MFLSMQKSILIEKHIRITRAIFWNMYIVIIYIVVAYILLFIF